MSTPEIPISKLDNADIKKRLDYWLDSQNIQLHAGEMSAQELRSVKAVVNAIKAGVPHNG